MFNGTVVFANDGIVKGVQKGVPAERWGGGFVGRAASLMRASLSRQA